MKQLTDQELIEELKDRFDLNRKALNDLQVLTRKLEVMNERLRDSEALKSHFLSNIRNEINNPLTSIMGLSRQLMEGKVDPAETAAVARMIHAEAFHLNFQLRNIFIAAELEAGEAVPALARTDVSGLIESAVEQVRHLAEPKSLSLKKNVAPGLYFITDAQKLQLVLTNLLANSVEFNKPGGEVSVRADLREGCLAVEVADSGIGIDPVDQERIFDRFHQLESGATKSHRGHGLGLSITKALVEMLTGTVVLESTRGQGCTVRLTLPEPEGEFATDVLASDGNLFIFDQPEKF